MNYNFSLEFMMMTKLIMCFDGKKKSQRISEIIIIIKKNIIKDKITKSQE